MNKCAHINEPTLGMMNERISKRRIVWVTFDFPPRISAGVFRPIKIYKYLDKSTLEVDFVTHGHAPRFRRSVLDHSLLAEVHPPPGIYRVPTVIPHDFLPGVMARLRGRAGRPAGAAKVGDASQGDSERRNPPRRAGRRGLSQTIYRWFVMSAYFPDHLFLWGWAAALKSLWLHVRKRYDVIYTTSYPESAHLAGFLLALFGVRWVADYRYGGPMWIKDVVGFRKPPLRERLDHWFQRGVLRRADCVITQSERIRADFCRVFALDPARVRVIPSGYDEEDFTEVDASLAPFRKTNGDVHLLHVGSLEGVGEPERAQILDALNGLNGALIARRRSLVVHAVGSDLFRPDQKASIGFRYRHYGVIAHCDIPPYLLAADCYLLSTMTTSHGGVKGFIPSKLWEYLRAGRPIVTVGPKDEVWAMIEQAGVGLQMGLNGDRAASIDGLADGLLRRMNDRTTLDGSVKRYSWESRARSLEDIFQNANSAVPIGQRRGDAVA
jgi:glycosyltransferase involved in cell wall biosynthesis